MHGVLAMLSSSLRMRPSKLYDAKRSFAAGKLLNHSPEKKLDSVAEGTNNKLPNISISPSIFVAKHRQSGVIYDP
jgi:hypothetical protein